MSFRIDRKEFKNRTNIEIYAEYIIPFRDLEKEHIGRIEVMKKETLDRLLKSIPLVNGEYPYKDSVIKVGRINPSLVYIGQTFVQKNKLEAIITLGNDFTNLMYSGLSKLNPLIIYDKKGEFASFYIPPIIEVNSKYVLLDGIHRSFIAKSIDATINAIIIDNVSSPLPFSYDHWEMIRLVEEKPKDIMDRYLSLKKEFFRNLKFVGIDG